MAERPLRILQVSTADIKGGAERVAWNLFTAYRARGYGSWLAVGKKRSHDRDVFVIPNQELHGRWYHFFQGVSSLLEQAERRLGIKTTLSGLAGSLSEPGRWLDYHLGVEDFHFPGTSRLLTLTGKLPDIFHAHNLHGDYFDLRMLPWLSQQMPVMMTLHDAWLLSGHCAHSFACEKWKTGCGQCPDLKIYPAIQRDETGYNWQRKRAIYGRSRLYVATPSRWLMAKVEQSMLAPAVVEARVLPNGVDLNIFHQADRQAVRAKLGIQQDAKLLLATGVMVRESFWKDYPTMREAVAQAAERLEGQDLLLIALGEDAPPERIGHAVIRFIPFQEDTETVANYYQAADIYVHTARADTFPTGVLEALACGTPVVATAVGGIPEQIEEARTGFLVPVGDAAGLAARITQVFLDHDLKQGMGMQAAESARQRFGLDRQVDAYLDWYHKLVWQKMVMAG
jgi:glycosyltransferase involved in cell wall biosynthesis